MSNWRTVGVRLKEEQVATLNQRLKQLGYSSLNEFVGGLTGGVITNRLLVEELAEALAGKIVNNLLTASAQNPRDTVGLLLDGSVDGGMERSLGRDLIPRPTAYKAVALPG